jgi:pimeloyl-ACP methyl ester carboxylesterase
MPNCGRTAGNHGSRISLEIRYDRVYEPYAVPELSRKRIVGAIRLRARAGATPPPAAHLLVHGAGSGPWIYDAWPESFPGLVVQPLDLQARPHVAQASHADYAASVVDAAASLPRPLALCGWSMGGLVVLQAAATLAAHRVILLEPSPPLEVQGTQPQVGLRAGTFDPEQVYGRFPCGVRARPESALARAERKRGISVPSLPCPSLVIYGDEFREERGAPIARLYGSEELYFPGLDHWGLVRDPCVRSAIADYLGVFRPHLRAAMTGEV